MATSKKSKQNPKPNPIEDAIGKRAKDPKAAEKFKAEYETEPLPPMNKMEKPPKPPTLEELKKQTEAKQKFLIPIDDSLPGEIPDKTTVIEMQSLEELNRQTESRLLKDDDPIFQQKLPIEKKMEIPVSKPDPQPATQDCSQESQPPKEKGECQYNELDGKPLDDSETPSAEDIEEAQKNTEEYKTTQFRSPPKPAEEPDLTTLKAYILDNGFTVAAVAMHVVMLCSQPQVTPATTDWDYRDRALIPDMISATLKSEGYIEECLWPSLKIIMGSNISNTAWTAEIAITLAFFDCILNLPDSIDL